MVLSNGFCYDSDVVSPEIMQIQGCSESSNPDMFVEMNQNENNSAHSFHQQQAMQEFHMIKNSNYLIPTQQLLTEFCSLHVQADISKQKPHKPPNQWNHDDEKQQCSVYSLDLMELQKRNTKLLSMLQRVDRRYKHYCDQMKGVVSSFEAIAGDGAANVYSKLASTAMSRHFRCLRDGIIGQIQETKKAMGDKDINRAGMGMSRVETPRLRLLDQTLRQQKSFHQIGFMENHPWKPQRGLPEKSVSLLRAWLFEHFLHPYPSDIDKHILARQTGLSRSQVSNWFINARVRLWKPMVEEMYLEETKEHEELDVDCPHEIIDQCNLAHQKPTPSQLLPVDPDSFSSIIHNNQDKTHHHQQTFGSFDTNMELDFSSYNPSTTVSYNNGINRNFNGGGGVSLTLGLQQHGGNGVSLAQSSLFYTRENIDQDSQYSFLDGEGETLLYRNSVGAQLLHDLSG